MKDYILNKVVLKTGDSLDIVESSTLPLTEKLMYKVDMKRIKSLFVVMVERWLFRSIISYLHLLFH